MTIGGGAAAAAAEMAEATATKAEPAVFCPPLCVFGNQRKEDGMPFAGESNIAEAPVLSIELDENPDTGLWRVIEVIGVPTVLVRSGGVCKTTGQDKLHAHWRLALPARDPDAIAKLKTARALAAGLANGDATSISPVHPIRWPGSLHRKDRLRPRLATAEFLGPEARDIELDGALAKLQAAADNAGLSVHGAQTLRAHKASPAGQPLDRRHLLVLAEAIPNPDRPDWERWSRIGMAFHAASAGNGDGLDAFILWSEKAASVIDYDAIDERWSHWDRSPAEYMTVDTLVSEAEKHEPGFRSRWTIERWFDEKAAAEAADRSFSRLAQAPHHSDNDERWPKPDDLFGFGDGLERQEPPTGALPSVLEDFSRDAARRMGASVAQFTGGTLAALSGAVGTKFRIQPKDRDASWAEFGVIWVMDVQPPGGKKTPVIRAVTQPLESLEAEWVEQDAPVFRAWLAQEKRKPKAGEPIMQEPVRRRCVAKDVTLEGLPDILRQNRSILYFNDELAAIIGGAGQYKQGKGNDRQKLLTLYDCNSVTIDRKTAGTVHVPVWGAAVYGGIQPGKLRELIASVEGDGFLQRFLVIHGDGTRRKGVDDEPGPSRERYRQFIREVAAVREAVSEPVKLSAAARAVWGPHEERWEALFDMQGASEAFQGHLSKMGGIAYRLLLLCHVANEWEPTGGHPETRLVSAKTATQAARLVSWFLTQSIRFYEDYVGAGEAVEDARWLADHLLTTGKQQLTRREIGRVRNAMAGKPWRMCAAMRQLEWANWVDVDPKGGSDKHGPEWWTVNPRVHVAFADRAKIVAAQRADIQERIRTAGEARRQIVQAA
ncbi:DUF3987 domain-containing protein [Phreatobacter oligotrophus]|nr:DUF3987 domain-containing protein [Phreatobacter oligotrophus]